MAGYSIPSVEQCAALLGTTNEWGGTSLPTDCTSGEISIVPADPTVSMAVVYYFFNNVKIHRRAEKSIAGQKTNSALQGL